MFPLFSSHFLHDKYNCFFCLETENPNVISVFLN